MCALHKVWIIFFSATFFITYPVPAYPQSSEESYQEVLAKLRSIGERVRKIEANQQEILVREEKILAELDRIRIWVRRS